jgi:hypothetical protein
MRYLIFMVVSVCAAMASGASPVHAGLNFSNHNETFLTDDK